MRGPVMTDRLAGGAEASSLAYSRDPLNILNGAALTIADLSGLR